MNTKKKSEYPEITKEMRIEFVKAREITNTQMVTLDLTIQGIEKKGLKLDTRGIWKAYEGLCKQIRTDEEIFLGKGKEG